MKQETVGRILCFDDGERLQDDFKIELFLTAEKALEDVKRRIESRKEDLNFLEHVKTQLEQNPVTTDTEKCSVTTAVEHDHENPKKPFAVVRETRFHVPVKRERLGNFETKDEAEKLQMKELLNEKD